MDSLWYTLHLDYKQIKYVHLEVSWIFLDLGTQGPHSLADPSSLWQIASSQMQ